MFESLGDWKKKTGGSFDEHGKVFACLIIIAACAVLILILVTVVTPEKLRVSFLDIGQGDSILIQTPSGKQMLIDGGPGNKVLVQLAEEMSYFDREIDVMIATHGDADHVTGLIPVLEKYRVQKIIYSPIEATTDVFDDLKTHIKSENAETHVGQKGDVIDFGDGVTAHVLYPNKNVSPRLETNDASVSIVVTYGAQSFLLTGDLGEKYEPQLIGKNLPKKVTVYKAGHHGSKTSSGEQLLTYIRPEYSVVSAGKDNRYGHPSTEAMERLTKYSKEILSTFDRGTITFVTDGKMLEVETDR